MGPLLGLLGTLRFAFKCKSDGLPIGFRNSLLEIESARTELKPSKIAITKTYVHERKGAAAGFNHRALELDVDPRNAIKWLVNVFNGAIADNKC